MSHSAPQWRWTAPTVDLWCSPAPLWQPTETEREDQTVLSRAWSGWFQQKTKPCSAHSRLAPCYLDHLRDRWERSSTQQLLTDCTCRSYGRLWLMYTHSWWWGLPDHWCRYWRVEHVTSERSLVILGHANSGIGASISDVNSVTGCYLGAAVHPEEREAGPSGDRALHDSWPVQFHQEGLVLIVTFAIVSVEEKEKEDEEVYETYGTCKAALWENNRGTASTLERCDKVSQHAVEALNSLTSKWSEWRLVDCCSRFNLFADLNY